MGVDIAMVVVLGSVIYLAVALIVLVTTRHVVAMRAQNVLTRRLYDAQRSLAHQVHHDPLTGLPNRLLFARRLDDALSDREFVLIFVDIDDFKEVNDQFGHAAGDELLCAVGERLRRCVGPADTLARIGGDEFAILIGTDDDVPEEVREEMTFHPVMTIGEVLELALEPAPTPALA